jgi:hypothetical protein
MIEFIIGLVKGILAVLGAFIIFMIVVVMIMGCSGQCIKVEGGYKEFKGGLTWCLDKELTAETGRETLKSDTGEAGIVIPEVELDVILNSLLSKPVQAASVLTLQGKIELLNKQIKERLNANSKNK